MALDPVEIVGGLAIGVGVGGAIADVVEPKLQSFKNTQWSAHANVPLSAHEAAELAAQGSDSPYASYVEALNTGYKQDRFDALVYLASTAPGSPELLQLWRYGLIDKDLVKAGLLKAGLLPDYIGPVMELYNSRLDSAVIATAIQRGIMKDPGFLPVGPPTTEGKVPAFPVSPLDPIAEATADGINADRLFVETAIVGLPLALDQAARATFRQIIEDVDFKRAVAEGNTRNEWGDAALEVAREILTAHDYAELELRGYYDRTTRLANTAKHGMSDADSDLLYDVLGRSIPVHQILTGERRGGVYDGPYDQVPEAFLSSLQRGNLRPEYYNLAYANRETIPSYFVLRALGQAGVLDEAQLAYYFGALGWPLAIADAAAAAYATKTAAAVDPDVKKAQTHLWNATHASYIAEKATAADVKPRLTLLGIGDTAQTQILALWDSQRALIRKELSPTQVKKAYEGKVTNPATGQPWTLDEAKQQLLDRGYDADDAATFLAE